MEFCWIASKIEFLKNILYFEEMGDPQASLCYTRHNSA